MKLLRPNGLSKCFAQTVEKIENECFLDLDLLVRTLECANPSRLKVAGNNPSGNRRDN
jgi:hypothetical protein